MADDELEVRISIIQKLKVLFPHEQIFDVGFGRQAVEQITLLQPDLVFLDIRMPELDGIEVLRLLRQTYPQLSVVIISGYDDFEYARKALQYGAKDYLLKPADRAKLYEIVEKVKIERVSAFLNELEMLITKTPRARAILKDIHPVNVSSWFDERETKRIIIGDELAADEESPQNILFTFSTDAGVQGKVVQISLDHGQGCFWDRDSFVDALLVENQRHKQLRFFQNTHFVTTASPKEQKEAGKQAAELRRDMVVRARLGDFSGLELYLEQWFGCLERAGYEEMQKECGYLMSLLDEGLSKQDVIYLEEDTLYYWADWVSKYRTWDELKGKIEKIVLGGVKALKSLEQQPEQQISGSQHWFQQALQLIEASNDPNLSLESVAEAVNVHPVTLSRIFKQQTGVNFVRYLTQKRMQLAQTLLLHTNKRIIEIAEEVGYSDYPYFRNKFKKEFGLSPSEFRKSHGLVTE
ncbi:MULTISPECIES: helix-turn-helix domain-containing protein [unclassified Paenibacillus]|uniref:response regulator transcription factor n=1 Tax=unclassified Paenibacillus TaxID=185978 RepID=UPI0024068375|nr:MULTISPECIES: helix-turn-helix domain-containing protein [unclassified Paenibacillus]